MQANTITPWKANTSFMEYGDAIDITKERHILPSRWITPGRISQLCDVIKMAVCLHLYDVVKGYI